MDSTKQHGFTDFGLIQRFVRTLVDRENAPEPLAVVAQLYNRTEYARNSAERFFPTQFPLRQRFGKIVNVVTFRVIERRQTLYNRVLPQWIFRGADPGRTPRCVPACRRERPFKNPIPEVTVVVHDWTRAGPHRETLETTPSCSRARWYPRTRKTVSSESEATANETPNSEPTESVHNFELHRYFRTHDINSRWRNHWTRYYNIQFRGMDVNRGGRGSRLSHLKSYQNIRINLVFNIYVLLIIHITLSSLMHFQTIYTSIFMARAPFEE